MPSGATYIIRRDVIEITTGTFAGAEKTVRVYPVADLVTPIPNAVNFSDAARVGHHLRHERRRPGRFRRHRRHGAAWAGRRPAAASALPAWAALAVSAVLAVSAAAVGGLGGVGGIAGLGGQGFNQRRCQQGGFQGNFQGRGNLGVGGGVVGFGGQQLGQFGNLGGQFGLQGGNQSQILITLIRQVVGKPKDWAIQFDPITGQPLNPLDDERARRG